MRQAGRYLPEYRALRGRYSFEDLCRRPEVTLEAVQQPLRRFPLDAAILFSDILVVPAAMGLNVSFPEGGPVLAPRVDGKAALARVVAPDVATALGYVARALDVIREGIGPKLALIGFAGAPYTLAAYMVEGRGSRRFAAIKALAYRQPEVLDELLSRITDVVVGYLRIQLAHGADCVQLFDTWAGDLGPGDFRRWALAPVRRITAALADAGAPIIYYVNGAAAHFDAMLESGAHVLGVDWRLGLEEARRRAAGRVALQGNLDPAELLGPEERIRRRVRELHAQMDGQAGHVFNLGHGVPPDTPVAAVAAFVDEVTRLGE